MAKKIVKGVGKVAGGVFGGAKGLATGALIGAALRGGKKKKGATQDSTSAPLNPMVSLSENAEPERRKLMRARAEQTSRGTILSDTLG